MQRYGPVKASGAQLDWSIDDPMNRKKRSRVWSSTPNGGSVMLPTSGGTTRGRAGNSCGSSSVSAQYDDSGEACATASDNPMTSHHHHRSTDRRARRRNPLLRGGVTIGDEPV
jgi:hypothetical protein